jgi:hypothetical protein
MEKEYTCGTGKRQRKSTDSVEKNLRGKQEDKRGWKERRTEPGGNEGSPRAPPPPFLPDAGKISLKYSHPCSFCHFRISKTK